MASAFCVNCLAEYGWSARRGSRLANHPSPCCGAAGTRIDRRRYAFLHVERFGSLEAPAQWAWTPDRLYLYLLANGNVQLDSRAIYAPLYRSGGALHFRYAGRDPFASGYRLRMADRSYQALVGEVALPFDTPSVVTVAVPPFSTVAVGIPVVLAGAPEETWPYAPPDLITGEGGTAQ